MITLLSWILFILIFFSLFSGACLGKMPDVSFAAINECSNAVTLIIELIGSICLWSGLMEIASRSGITEKISQCLYFITGKIFSGLKKGSAAMKYISMNVTSNLLGLGNAATPLGISAMRELESIGGSDTASNNMILFVVMNTASIQLLPNSSIVSIRASLGSASPLDILPAVWIVSFLSLSVSLLSAKLLCRISDKVTHKNRR